MSASFAGQNLYKLSIRKGKLNVMSVCWVYLNQNAKVNSNNKTNLKQGDNFVWDQIYIYIYCLRHHSENKHGEEMFFSFKSTARNSDSFNFSLSALKCQIVTNLLPKVWTESKIDPNFW